MFIPLLQGAGLLSSGLWTYRPVLIAQLLLTPAGCIAQNLVVPQRERRGKESLDGGNRPSPPILSTSGSAGPRAEGKPGSVMPAAKCGDPQKSQEREDCMFNEKHLKGKEGLRLGCLTQHPAEPPEGLLFCSLRNEAL